jgi:hypothetical protein
VARSRKLDAGLLIAATRDVRAAIDFLNRHSTLCRQQSSLMRASVGICLYCRGVGARRTYSTRPQAKLQQSECIGRSSRWGALDSQFWTANVNPSDRYVQSPPKTTRFRISPLDNTYDNLTIVGDWTACGLNVGCVEAAVMSGRLAAHALAGALR